MYIFEGIILVIVAAIVAFSGFKLLPNSRKRIINKFEKLTKAQNKLIAMKEDLSKLSPYLNATNLEIDRLKALYKKGSSKELSSLLAQAEKNVNNLTKKVNALEKKSESSMKQIQEYKKEYYTEIREYSKLSLLIDLSLVFFVLFNIFNWTNIFDLAQINISHEYYSSVLQLLVALIIALYLSTRWKGGAVESDPLEMLETKTRVMGITYGLVGIAVCLITIGTNLSTYFEFITSSFCLGVLAAQGVKNTLNTWHT